jgi:hypothetical protein
LGFRISIFGFWDCPYVDSRFFRIASHRTAPHRTAICFFEKKEHTHCNTAPQFAIFRKKTRIAPHRTASRTNVGQMHKTNARNATQRNATQRNATQRNATQRNATQRNATQRNATQRNATQDDSDK